MKIKILEHKKYIQIGLIAFLVIAASMLFYFALFHGSTMVRHFKHAASVMAPVIYGLAIAFLLIPVASFFENTVGYGLLKVFRKTSSKPGKVIRWVCAIIALIVFIALIYGLLSMVLPELIRSIINLISNLPTYIKNVNEWIESGSLIPKDMVNEELMEKINSYTTQAVEYINNNLLPQLQNMLVNITSGVFDVVIFFKNFFIGCLISLYVMADRDEFVARGKMVTYAIFPIRWANFLIRSMRYAGYTFSGFISGKIIDSAIIGVICYAGCYIMDMPFTTLIAVVIGVTNMIPFFGPFLGAIPCLFLILLVDPIKCLYFLIFILILQQFDGNILGPKILGDSTGLSSFMVIVAILIGGGFFGVFGMLLGVPTFAVLYNFVIWLTHRTLRSKSMSDSIDTYVGIDRLNPKTLKPMEFDPERDRIRVSKEPKRRSALSIAFMKLWDTLILIIASIFKIIFMAIRYVINSIRAWAIKIFGSDRKKR